jgi:phage terminase large subunit-like protein
MAKPIQIQLDDLHTGQRLISSQRKRFNVLSCGRRWGKTHMTNYLIAEIVRYNMERGLKEDMGYMSPTYKNLAPTWRNFVRTFKPIITYKSEQDHVAEILDSFFIEFWSLDKPENIRGRRYKRLIIDEAALIHALRHIFKVILLPTIGDLVGDAWFFSTPRGFNDFNHMYKLGQNPLYPAWASWIMPTSTNPYFPKAELLEQKSLLDPDEFAQEWEGKFVSLGNSPFDIDYFKMCKNFEEAIVGQGALYHLRYWDIANSEAGDYTASTEMIVTDEPNFIICDPMRLRGTWGVNYQTIKSKMLTEPHVLHTIETEGVGGIAYQMLKMDADLAHLNILPAGKQFTIQSKEERANIWAMELRNRRMKMVEEAIYQDVLDEIAAFPNGNHDDLVDTISGNMLSFIYYCGGYSKLLDSKKIHKQSIGKIPDFYKDDLILDLADEFSGL